MRTERSAYFRKDEVVNQFTEEHYSIASLELANDWSRFDLVSESFLEFQFEVCQRFEFTSATVVDLGLGSMSEEEYL